MATDLRAIMRRDERRRQMLNDPDLTGDTLLLALALDEVLLTQREERRRGQRRMARSRWIPEVQQLAKGDQHPRNWWVRYVIAEDIPRYEPVHPTTPALACPAPMIRREGPCGKHGTNRLIDHDPVTGEAQWLGLCSRHRELQQTFYEKRRREWIANGAPVPPPNVGGVLERYYATDWDVLYQWAGPHRRPVKDRREPTPPRPRLRLIQGGGDVEPDPGADSAE